MEELMNKVFSPLVGITTLLIGGILTSIFIVITGSIWSILWFVPAITILAIAIARDNTKNLTHN